MKNLQYMFDGIPAINHKKNKDINKEKLIISKKVFTFECVMYIIEHFNWKIKYNSNSRVKIEIECPIIGDDATLIVFESVIYFLIRDYNFDIQYIFKTNRNLVGYGLYEMSNLFIFDGKKIDKQEFMENYEKVFDISRNHYKKLCINNDINTKGPFLSLLTDDICNFLKNNGIEQDYYETMGETIIEIVGNCLEHSDADLLLDIKITQGYKENKLRKFLNVTTFSCTKGKFGQDLKKFLFSEEEGYNTSNEIVKRAYDIQKDKFSDKYSLENFIMVSSFQKNVSTRKNSEGSGGKGLTFFLETLIDLSIADFCYAQNGNTVIFLRKPYLHLNDDGTIGFNESKNYVSDLPDSKIVSNLKKCLNCTIYNLSFILGGKENE